MRKKKFCALVRCGWGEGLSINSVCRYYSNLLLEQEDYYYEEVVYGCFSTYFIISVYC
jgi:hypothetical protein